MDSAEAHAVAQRATGCAPAMAEAIHGAAALGDAFSELLKVVNAFAASVGALMIELEKLEDPAGRPIWMTAGEVELDQWLSRVSAAQVAVREHLG
jgi:hypothetical protein